MNTKMVLVVRKDLQMRKGKIGAQCGHAALGIILDALKKDKECLNKSPIKEWLNDSFRKICVYVNSEEELIEIEQKAKEQGLRTKMIIDAGQTEFHDVPTRTVLAIGPDYNETIDEVTGSLPLY